MMNNTDIYNPQSIGLVRDVLTIGDDKTPFAYIWCNGNLYVQEIVSGCPNYKESFVWHKATIQQLDANSTKYKSLFPLTSNNNIIDSIAFDEGDVLVIGCPSYGYRATFVAAKQFTVTANHYVHARDITVAMLLNRCIEAYPKDLFGKNLLKKQIREFADNALRKLTGAFLILTCGVILLSSYYNVYKIFTGGN